MNKKELLNKRINQHGENLNRIFKTSLNNVELSKKLLKIENKARSLATSYCNGELNSVEEWETETQKILKRLDKILNFTSKNIPVFVNGDARGYALKINDDYVRDNNIEIYKDWGGYGILAPDLRE